AKGELETACTCPYAYGGDCKHIVATLLAWLNEPDRFQPPVDWRSILNKRRKSELVDLLLKAIALQPDLVDDLNLKQQTISLANPERVVADVFEAMDLYGRLTAGQAAARLEQIAQQADRLAKQGQAELARHTYYEIVVNCVRLFTPYGHELIAPYEIPYKFATAYADLALQQLDDHRAVIEAEVRDMHQSEYIDEMVDLWEALTDLEDALGWYD
ncbi:MAG TPA: SWIM zinc finger family protein, partial [Anaerolineae bacterium]|nr:SWIM zinc finger family protein [Anaerolineae bacterium]